MKKLILFVLLFASLFIISSCNDEKRTENIEDDSSYSSDKNTELNENNNTEIKQVQVEYCLNEQLDFIIPQSNIDKILLFDIIDVHSDYPIVWTDDLDKEHILNGRFYILVEWFLDESLTQRVPLDYVPTEDVVLYGKEVCDMRFDQDGILAMGETHSPEDPYVVKAIYCNYDEKVVLKKHYVLFEHINIISTKSFTVNDDNIKVFKNIEPNVREIDLCIAEEYNKETSFILSNNLKEIEFNDNFINRNIDEYFFNRARNLEKIIINSDIDTIEENAFRSLTNLKEIVINGNIKNIANNAFVNLSNIEKIIINGNVDNYNLEMINNCNVNVEIIINDK